jgi:hypothetical protein
MFKIQESNLEAKFLKYINWMFAESIQELWLSRLDFFYSFEQSYLVYIKQ